MSDTPERTPEEREAARLARERRRGGVFNESANGAGFLDWADANGAPTAEPEPRPEPAAAADPHTEEHALPDEEAAAADDAPLPDGDADRPDDEVPSGTRRVSRADRAGLARATGVGSRSSRSSRSSRPPRSARAAVRATSAPRPPRPPRRPRAARAAAAGDGAASSRRFSWVGRIIALVVVALVAVLAWFVVELFQPFGSSPHGRVTVVVPAHAGSHQIGNLLAREGVIPSGFFFELRASLAGDRGKLRSGTYHLQQGMSYGAVLTALTRIPKAAPTTSLTIAEGHTRQYVARLLRRQHVPGNYLALTRHSPLLNPAAYGAPRSLNTLEGFLFPDTFTLLDPVRASALVSDQLRDFKQRFAQVNLSYARSKHLTAYDVLKIASLIEAEAASSHDRPLVASVIYNRLHDGRMLQFDSTTRYATGNFTKPLLESQLHSPSPYNTHTHFGLPPTPIDSPSLASIQAAADPAQTNYLYFFTKPCNEGGSVFTSSYTEFLYLLAKDKRDHC